MAEGGISVKAEKAVESAEVFAVPTDVESGVSDDERALLEKLKRLEKRKNKGALERKAKLVEAEISRISISDEIGKVKEVEGSNGCESRDGRGQISRRSRDKRRAIEHFWREAAPQLVRQKFVHGGAPTAPWEMP